MNGYDRISAALKGDNTDTTPIMLHNFLMAAKEYGASMKEFRNDPKIIAKSFIASVEKYQFDGILVDIDTVTLAGAVGVSVDFPVNEPARTNKGFIDNLNEVKKLKPINIENYKYIQVWLEAVRILKEHFKNEIFIRGNCDQAPFSLAGMVRGMQNWIIDLMTSDENLIFDLLEYCTNISGQFIKLMAQTGCDMLSNGDSPAGPEMISPDMYEKFAFPYEKRIVEMSHKNNMPYVLHICGNTELILNKMIDSGADAIELDYKTNIKKNLHLFQNGQIFIGNIDPSGVLAMGTVDEVKAKTIELLDLFNNNNAFILNAGCAIPANTPSKNITAMIKTSREYKS